jgi:hypothetical protein
MMCEECKQAGTLLGQNIKDDGSLTDALMKIISGLHTACKTISCTCQHKIGKYISTGSDQQ